MEGFELLDDGVDLGDGELGAAGADVDFGDGVGIGADAAAGERWGGHFFDSRQVRLRLPEIAV